MNINCLVCCLNFCDCFRGFWPFQMYNACGLLFLSFGFTMLKFISCYSDGFLLESECQGMNVNHGYVGRVHKYTLKKKKKKHLKNIGQNVLY